MKTVAELIRWRARQHAERLAVVHEERELSYVGLDRAASRVANALIGAGVQAGDRVCVLDKGHDRFFEVIFGIAKAGAVFAPVNWRLAPPEIAYVINDAGAPVVFVGAEFQEALSAVQGNLQAVRTIIRFDASQASRQDVQIANTGEVMFYHALFMGLTIAIVIKGVHRLTQLEHDVIRQVDQHVDRPEADVRKPGLHP